MPVEGLPALGYVLVCMLAALKPAIHGQLVQFVHPRAELGLLQESVAFLVSSRKRLFELILKRLPDLVTALFR